VKKCEVWLRKANTIFSPTTFIAYKDELPVGMIEFVPQRLLKKVRLCPCRVDADNNEVEERYILGEKFENCLFISCLFVGKAHQGKSVGKTLLAHFLNSEVFKESDGALVYATERDKTWSEHIHWPAGPKEFYIKAGFSVLKTMENPKGTLLCLKKESKQVEAT
jgi:GNAT superfamily N-acetyltransferase